MLNKDPSLHDGMGWIFAHCHGVHSTYINFADNLNYIRLIALKRTIAAFPIHSVAEKVIRTDNRGCIEATHWVGATYVFLHYPIVVLYAC